MLEDRSVPIEFLITAVVFYDLHSSTCRTDESPLCIIQRSETLLIDISAIVLHQGTAGTFESGSQGSPCASAAVLIGDDAEAGLPLLQGIPIVLLDKSSIEGIEIGIAAVMIDCIQLLLSQTLYDSSMRILYMHVVFFLHWYTLLQ